MILNLLLIYKNFIGFYIYKISDFDIFKIIDHGHHQNEELMNSLNALYVSSAEAKDSWGGGIKDKGKGQRPRTKAEDKGRGNSDDPDGFETTVDDPCEESINIDGLIDSLLTTKDINDIDNDSKIGKIERHDSAKAKRLVSRTLSPDSKHEDEMFQKILDEIDDSSDSFK
jgi:hypothetical protein